MTEAKCFFVLLLAGVVCGAIWGLKNGLTSIIKNAIWRNVLDFLTTVCCALVFFGMCVYCNLGEIRFYLAFSFVVGFSLERLTLGNLFAKSATFIYNKLNKITKKVANSRFVKLQIKVAYETR